MTDRERFLRAIEAAPDDDAPRLVFADWLDEHDDPDRARFIRLQCEAYRLQHYPPSRRLDELSAKEKRRLEILMPETDALLGRNRAAWTAGLPKWAKDERFERGFPDFYSITGKQLADDGAAIRAVAPLGGYLSLRLLKGREAAVFASEHLAAVTRLYLDRAQLTDAGVGLLTTSPHLTRVAELNLSRSRYSSLDKDVNRLTDAAAVALAGAANLPALTDLGLDGYKKLTAAGVRAVVESPRRAGLTGLDVSHGPGGAKFVEVFRSPKFRLTKLESLNLADRGIDDAGAAVLAACPALARLTTLHLYDNPLTDAGVRTILTSPHLRAVRALSFGPISGTNPHITDATARAILADRRRWVKVDLYNTAVSEPLRAEVAARCAAAGR